MLHREAKNILDKYCLEKTGKVASTGNRKSHLRPIDQSLRLDWWTEGGNTRVTTERTLAYLNAYKDITGSPSIPAVGIKLQDDYIWIDKGVVRFAIAKGLIKFNESNNTFIIL